MNFLLLKKFVKVVYKNRIDITTNKLNLFLNIDQPINQI